jgi:hypothetical protein
MSKIKEPRTISSVAVNRKCSMAAWLTPLSDYRQSLRLADRQAVFRPTDHFGGRASAHDKTIHRDGLPVT